MRAQSRSFPFSFNSRLFTTNAIPSGVIFPRQENVGGNILQSKCCVASMHYNISCVSLSPLRGAWLLSCYTRPRLTPAQHRCHGAETKFSFGYNFLKVLENIFHQKDEWKANEHFVGVPQKWGPASCVHSWGPPSSVHSNQLQLGLFRQRQFGRGLGR